MIEALLDRMNEGLEPRYQDLLRMVFVAHERSAFRYDPETQQFNASSQALLLSAFGQGKFIPAVATALLTLGGNHAPLEAAYEFFDNEECVARAALLLSHKQIIPGFGNSFVRGQHDPDWAEVREWFETNGIMWRSRVLPVMDMLHEKGKYVFPNPACYTALTAILIGLPKQICPMLFIGGRLRSWAALFNNYVGGKT